MSALTGHAQFLIILIGGGIKIEEMARVAGLEAPAIEVKATKTEENEPGS